MQHQKASCNLITAEIWYKLHKERIKEDIKFNIAASSLGISLYFWVTNNFWQTHYQLLINWGEMHLVFINQVASIYIYKTCTYIHKNWNSSNSEIDSYWSKVRWIWMVFIIEFIYHFLSAANCVSCTGWRYRLLSHQFIFDGFKLIVMWPNDSCNQENS